MCGYFCIGFIDFMLKVKTPTYLTNLFSPNDFKKNDNSLDEIKSMKLKNILLQRLKKEN